MFKDSKPAAAASISEVRGRDKLFALFRMFRWTVYGCALIALILLLHKSAPPAVTATPEAAASAEQKVQQVQQAVAQGQPATLRMNEAELNSYLASHLVLAEETVVGAGPNAGSDAGLQAPSGDQTGAGGNDVQQMRSNVRDVKVQLIGDRARAYVVFNLHGKDMTLWLEGRVRDENGFLRFEPLSGQIGALPIPQSTLRAAMQRLMNSPENQDKLRLPADMSDLRVENSEVVADYQ
ncbi:MAG TPA: hypothetical protein VJN93_06800 [Candidatus Acidoferrum sp.]|nr:hypothetical protein [Candidatus Acidoferrum sp.]